VKANKSATFLPGFSNKVKGLRMSRGMSQVAFARLLHVTPGAVCNWEKGVNGPSEKKLAAIAKTLKVPFDFFVSLPDGTKIAGEVKWPDRSSEENRKAEACCMKLYAIARENPKVAKAIFLLIEGLEDSLNGGIQPSNARAPSRRKGMVQ
jgi:transcriptional regulator with XRE-family HTH domain